MSSKHFMISVTTSFKKYPIESSKEFKTEWSAKKEYVRRVTGHGGSYQANKEKRRSESFPWPSSGRSIFLM